MSRVYGEDEPESQPRFRPLPRHVHAVQTRLPAIVEATPASTSAAPAYCSGVGRSCAISQPSSKATSGLDVGIAGDAGRGISCDQPHVGGKRDDRGKHDEIDHGKRQLPVPSMSQARETVKFARRGGKQEQKSASPGHLQSGTHAELPGQIQVAAGHRAARPEECAQEQDQRGYSETPGMKSGRKHEQNNA